MTMSLGHSTCGARVMRILSPQRRTVEAAQPSAYTRVVGFDPEPLPALAGNGRSNDASDYRPGLRKDQYHGVPPERSGCRGRGAVRLAEERQVAEVDSPAVVSAETWGRNPRDPSFDPRLDRPGRRREVTVITLDCPVCHCKLSVTDERAGKKGKCPRCGQRVLIPGAPRAPAAATPGSSAAPAPAAPPPASGSAPVEDDSARSPAAAVSDSVGDSETVWSAPPQSGGAGSGEPGPRATPAPAGKVPAKVTALLAPARAPDEIGRLGDYRILRVLGVGGMGVVFQAEDVHLRRPVALKAMLPRTGPAENSRKRFLREARAAAALKHDHVVTIYHVGEDRGIPFLAMEFLDGESLDTRLKRVGRLPPAEVVRVGREVAEGLAAAHARGLIHRDIKPGNLWLEGERSRVKILDFGLVLAAGENVQLTRSGAIVGTPAYMAPEQARGEPVDGRSDLFSLGGVLYRACTGRLPFKGKDTMSTLMALATTQPTAPCELSPELPPALSDLIMGLLAKNPDDRPANARAVADALAALVGDPAASTVEAPSPFAELPVSVSSVIRAPSLPPPATPAGSSPSKPGPWGLGQRRWWLAGGLFGLVVAVALGAWGLTQIGGGEGELVLEADDPAAVAKVVKAVARARDAKTGRLFALRIGKQGLPSGDYEADLTDAGASLRFQPKSFTIQPGTPTVLKVWIEPKKSPVAVPPVSPIVRTDQSGLDADGFIQRWLVLAPIPLAPNEPGAAALGKEQLPDEAKLRPAAGEKVKVGDRQLVWREYLCPDFLLDFTVFLGAQTEDSVAYAMTLVVAPEEFKGVRMKTGSDDQAKVYLNGKEVFKFTEPRPTARDQDTTEVTLNKGVNVLVVKVVNEKVDWSFCVRFTDKDDKPLPGLKAQTKE
jgi:serine/threonine protein kinase